MLTNLINQRKITLLVCLFLTIFSIACNQSLDEYMHQKETQKLSHQNQKKQTIENPREGNCEPNCVKNPNKDECTCFISGIMNSRKVIIKHCDPENPDIRPCLPLTLEELPEIFYFSKNLDPMPFEAELHVDFMLMQGEFSFPLQVNGMHPAADEEDFTTYSFEPIPDFDYLPSGIYDVVVRYTNDEGMLIREDLEVEAFLKAD